MASGLYLQYAGILLSYFLKVGAGFLLCFLLARIMHRPALRFRVWLMFTLGSGVLWIALLGAAVGHFFPGYVGTSGHLAAPGSVSTPAHWLVPQRWGHDVMLAGRTVLCLYLGTMFLLACSKAWKHVRLRRLFTLGWPASPEVNDLFDQMCGEYGLSGCRLAVLPGLSSPATAYWWTPRVVLPEEIAAQGATEDVASVLYHELAHIRRRDYFWANVTDFICGMVFFHPAVWQARKHMRLERELACDLAVVNARPEYRADYAHNLARVVRRRMVQDGASCGVDFAASPSMLGQRIRNILAEPPRLPWWKKLSVAATSVALLLGFMAVSPELSVGIDFSSEAPLALPAGVQPALKPSLAHRRRAAQALLPAGHQDRIRKGHPAPAGPHEQDSLRNVRTRSYAETPAYRFAGGNYMADTGAAPNWESPALNDQTPATPHLPKPTVTGVVLSTVGEILIHERSERRLPGPRTREKVLPSAPPAE